MILFYTDGITETRKADGELFGIDRLDAVLRECSSNAAALIEKHCSQ